MKYLFRGVRVIDSLVQRDETDRDVLIKDGKILAIERHIRTLGATEIDFRGSPDVIFCPSFIDIHAHVRQPGGDRQETIETATAAAAAGGYGAIVAMANTNPPINTPGAVAAAVEAARDGVVPIFVTAAVTRDLRGAVLADLDGCTAAGAVAFSDDGRNGASVKLLAEALRSSARLQRPILIHPEDESMIVGNSDDVDVTLSPHRNPDTEVHAVNGALQALQIAHAGRLHLQHLSTASAIDSLRLARERHLAVTAEVTPHHLSMWLPVSREPQPQSLRKVNPPLRSYNDRLALVNAVRDGTIDAIATDHAPHTADSKNGDYDTASPGMIGLETALALCVTFGGMGGKWLPTLVERLTVGPWTVINNAAIPLPHLTLRRPGSFTVFDANADWTIDPDRFRSRSRNTPFAGIAVHGKVLCTCVNGEFQFIADDPRCAPLIEDKVHA